VPKSFGAGWVAEVSLLIPHVNEGVALKREYSIRLGYSPDLLVQLVLLQFPRWVVVVEWEVMPSRTRVTRKGKKRVGERVKVFVRPCGWCDPIGPHYIVFDPSRTSEACNCCTEYVARVCPE
jgi:hypothetical protein